MTLGQRYGSSDTLYCQSITLHVKYGYLIYLNLGATRKSHTAMGSNDQILRLRTLKFLDRELEMTLGKSYSTFRG
jgi:hypothetical protein